MDKKLINFFLDSGSGYSSEFQSVLDRATTEGYTKPSDLSKGNTLMQTIQPELVNLDALFIFWNDGSVGFGNINWANPTGNLAINNGATWISNIGYTTNGTSTYVDSNHVLSTLSKYALNGASMGVYIKTNITGAVDLKAAFGCRDNATTDAAYLMQRTTGAFRFPVNNTTAVSVATGLTLFGNNTWNIIKRANVNDQTFWEDKTLKGTVTNASEAVPAISPWIGAYNNSTVFTSGLAAEFGAFFIGNSSLNTDLIVDAFDAYIA